MKPLIIFLIGLLTTIFCTAQTHANWIKQSVFYQIYPSSFQDNDGNGIGDLKGIQSRLGYVDSLGVNAIWLNPVFKSAFKDGGYDVIDFYQVDPRFGTNTDLVELTKDVHKRGMHLVLDLVAGHSSNESEWFKQSMDAVQTFVIATIISGLPINPMTFLNRKLALGRSGRPKR